MSWRALLLAALFPLCAGAQNINPYQPLQPAKTANYNARVAGLPQMSALTFSAELESNLTADVGSNPTFVRASSFRWSDTLSTVATVTTGNPFFGVNPGGSDTVPGFYLYHRHINSMLYSDQLDNAAWTATGTMAVTANDCTAPDGTATAELLEANSNNDAIYQMSVQAADVAANGTNAGGMWLKAVTGTVTGVISLIDQGETETDDTPFSVGTTWEYVHAPWHLFTAGAAGNVGLKVSIDNSGDDLCGWGGALSQHGNNFYFYTTVDQGLWSTMSQTTSAAVGTVDHDLYIGAADWDTDVFSVSVWVKPLNGRAGVGGNLSIFSNITTNGEFAVYQTETAGYPWRLTYDGVSHINNNTHGKPLLADTWQNIVATVDQPSGVVALYYNGALIEKATGLSISDVLDEGMRIGSQTDIRYATSQNTGVWRKWHVWSTELTASEVLKIYNVEKGDFGL